MTRRAAAERQFCSMENVEYRVLKIQSNPERSAQIESRNAATAEQSYLAWLKKGISTGLSCLALMRMRLALAARS